MCNVCESKQESPRSPFAVFRDPDGLCYALSLSLPAIEAATEDEAGRLFDGLIEQAESEMGKGGFEISSHETILVAQRTPEGYCWQIGRSPEGIKIPS